MNYKSLLVALMFAALAVPALARKPRVGDETPAASRVERKPGRECDREAETHWKDSRKPWV